MRNLSRRRFLATGTQTALTGLVLRNTTFGKSYLKERDNPVVLQQPDSGKFAAAFAKLDAFIARHLKESGAPGLTLAVANRAGVLKTSGYGFADTKAQIKVTPDTLFEIGSISKSFVALTLFQLHQEKKLDLHKPVVEYLPWLKISSQFEPITTSHILSHTAGLPAAPLLLDALLAELSVAYAPGKRFLYSNTGYNILGFLIEKLDQRPFAESIRFRILKPLSMNATTPVISHETRTRMAVGYEPFREGLPFASGGRLGEAQWLEMDMAAGSIASTPGDMAKYLSMLANKGKTASAEILSNTAFGQFIEPQVKSPFRGEDASYAHGLWVSEINGHMRLRHTGGMVAFSSSLDVDVTSGIGAFASVNASLVGYRPVAVTRYALDLINAALEEKQLPDPPPSPRPATEVTNASEYAGLFTSPDGRKLQFVADQNKLYLQHGSERVALERSGRDLFIVKHQDFEVFMLGFVRDQEKITEAYYGADWYAGSNYTGPKTFETPREWAGYLGHYANDSPWYGDTRIVTRKGKLFSDGVQPLLPRADGKFSVGGPESPDWLEFQSIIDGRAMRLSLSGIIFRRTFTP
jgi:CubicO group peptidase (beta-lactamase class C family)